MSPRSTIEFENFLPLAEGSCRVIAEAGVNHNGSLKRALEMADAAAAAGAWAIKFQLYKSDRLAVADSPKYWDDALGTDSQQEAFAVVDDFSYDNFGQIADHCRGLGILPFATPFDTEAIAVMEQSGAPLYKVASGDITNKPLLEQLRETGKPVLLSTGASTPDEITAAVNWLGDNPATTVPLACTLTYPTPDTDANFARIQTLRELFPDHLIGQSDHTLGTDGGFAAAMLGAACIEKHYTLDNTLGMVPDHKISVDPEALADLVRKSDRGALLRGTPDLAPCDSELAARSGARRSLVYAADLPAHHTLHAEDFEVKRPGNGMSPAERDSVVGMTLSTAVERDQLVDPTQLEADPNIT